MSTSSPLPQRGVPLDQFTAKTDLERGRGLGRIGAVDAAGIITTNHVPAPLLTRLSEALPLVQCCEYNTELPVPYVSIDDVAAARTVMDYLLSLGCRKIALIGRLGYIPKSPLARGSLGAVQIIHPTHEV
jgi:hypothetical protein